MSSLATGGALARRSLDYGYLLQRLAAHTILIVLGLIFILSFLWMVNSSLKSNADIFDIPVRLIPGNLRVQQLFGSHLRHSLPALSGQHLHLCLGTHDRSGDLQCLHWLRVRPHRMARPGCDLHCNRHHDAAFPGALHSALHSLQQLGLAGDVHAAAGAGLFRQRLLHISGASVHAHVSQGPGRPGSMARTSCRSSGAS